MSFHFEEISYILGFLTKEITSSIFWDGGSIYLESNNPLCLIPVLIKEIGLLNFTLYFMVISDFKLLYIVMDNQLFRCKTSLSLADWWLTFLSCLVDSTYIWIF